MRRVIYSHHVSLDGFIAGPNGELDWGVVDEELYGHFNALEDHIDAHLYGRGVYEAMAAFLPTADQDPSAPAYVVEAARIWRDKPKIVFSRTLERVQWNSRLIRSDVAEEIATLKAQPGKDMYLAGANLASTLIPLGLIDEYWLYVHPVLLGQGKPMFQALEMGRHLRPLEARMFGCGVMLLRYQDAGGRVVPR